MLRRPSTAVNALLALLIVGVAFWGWSLLRNTSDSQANAGMRTVTAARGTVTRTVSADGAVQSASTATATFGTAGIVTGIRVKVGRRVAAGTLLARIDDTGAKRDLALARADLDAAGNAVRRAEAAGIDTTTALNAVTEAELTVDQAGAAVAGTRLTAPMTGTVAAVRGTLGSWSRDFAVDIVDLTTLQVDAAFAEAGATELQAGQTATVTWNALRGAETTGRVVAVDPTATTGDDGATYGVTVSLPNPPEGARPGQTVTISVITGNVENAVMVNAAAVTTVGDRHVVTVVGAGDQREVRPVQVGLEGDDAYQITSGLTAGERVVVPPGATTGR